MTEDEGYIEAAIGEAQKSKQEGGRPFGSVLVKDGEVVAAAYNRVIQDSDPTSHAELNVIRSYCEGNGLQDLQGHTLYTTCEPCPMCTSAIVWANISTIVFGADRADGPTHYHRQTDISCEEVVRRSGMAINVIPYVLRERCASLFQ